RSALLADLVGPDLEADQGVRPEREGNRHVGGIASMTDQDASDAGNIVAGIEGVPVAAEIGLEPAGEIHRGVGRRNADVAEIARAIALRNVHATAEGDRQVGIVAANAAAFVERLLGRLRRSSVLVAEGDVAMNVVADGLDVGPAGRRAGKKASTQCRRAGWSRSSGCQQKGDRVGGQVLHGVLGRGRGNYVGQAESRTTPSPYKRTLPAGATIRLHQFPKAS